MSDEDWIEWRGGECPVSSDTLVDVRWNNGAVSRAMQAGTWGPGKRDGLDFWSGPNSHGWISGYRLTTA